MQRNPETVLKYLSELEEVAEEILADRQQVVNLDRRRNQNREGVRAVMNELKASTGTTKSWVCLGNTFVKMDKAIVKDFLEKDQTTLNDEITNLRNGLHAKVARLNDIEGKPELRGFDLQPLPHESLAINTFL